MIYWHVEKKSLCIHSQLKSPSSSEVASMIEGVIRHCTEMSVDRQYVDSHGQSEVAFAFCRLLGFQLLPRLKNIGRQRLYRPAAGQPEAYPRLRIPSASFQSSRTCLTPSRRPGHAQRVAAVPRAPCRGRRADLGKEGTCATALSCKAAAGLRSMQRRTCA